MTIRNYRQISKTDTAGVAMGGARCRAVRDRIKFKITIESFTLYDQIPITDSITFSYEMEAPTFMLTDTIQLADSIGFDHDPEAPAYEVQEQMGFDILDDIDYEEE